jgi:maltose alpha-D-glucosyltransferase/alpha-amylase
MVDVDDLGDGETETYFLPLTLGWGEDEERWQRLLPVTLAKVRHRAHVGILYDAYSDPAFCRAIIEGMRDSRRVPLGTGTLRFEPTHAYSNLVGDEWHAAASEDTMRRPPAEGSNSAVIVNERLFLKGYRHMRRGIHPEVEIGRFLTDVARFDHTVPVAGSLELEAADGSTTSLAVLQAYVPNQGDAWSLTVDQVVRFLEDSRLGDAAPPADFTLEMLAERTRLLGKRTAELHRALADSGADAAFLPEPLTADDMVSWSNAFEQETARTLDMLAARLDVLPPAARPLAERLLTLRAAFSALTRNANTVGIAAGRTRYHGDYHLGQVLIVHNDFVIVDFEGEPARSLEERRAKYSPLRDVAGMLRSFDYAAHMALDRIDAAHDREREQLEARAHTWRQRMEDVFLEAYFEAMSDQPNAPRADVAQQLVRFFTIEKALYEVRYELGNRPDWVRIPLSGLLAHLETFEGAGQQIP